MQRWRGPRPLLFAIVQGGASEELRKVCVQRLVERGFDGYGYGGWPIDDDGQLLDMVSLVARLLPPDAPKHALGVGILENIVRAYRAGFHLFDCVLPTRDARRGRLYVLNPAWEGENLAQPGFYRFLYIRDEGYCTAPEPVGLECDCLTCKNYTRAYLHHLFRVDPASAFRLATIHNLRTFTRVVTRMKLLTAPRGVLHGQ
jgi:queuine tRNA-ribosyltransferase